LPGKHSQPYVWRTFQDLRKKSGVFPQRQWRIPGFGGASGIVFIVVQMQATRGGGKPPERENTSSTREEPTPLVAKCF
jgi:hypothetical protein